MNPDLPNQISANLQRGIASGAFPGAVCAYSRDGATLSQAAGDFGIEAPFLRPVSAQTIYDLASISKIYTLAATLCALRDAKIGLNAPLSRFFPAFDPKITLQLLMAHASGIGFAVQKLEAVEADDWIAKIADAPLESAPGTQVLYSCTNYFLLARIAEQISGETLDSLVKTRICAPLGLENTTFAPQNLDEVAPTERCDPNDDLRGAGGFRHGIVHDEAARSWRVQTGNGAGNAGVFAPAEEVARFARIWAENGAEILHPEDAVRAFEPLFPENSYTRGLGFQIDAAFYMSDAAPKSTAGHTGFTGPSMLVTPQGAVLVILNNRVHPTRNGPERLPFHCEIAGAFFK